MKKNIIAIGIGIMFLGSASSASALSCLPIDMYLDTVINDGSTSIFIGTASEVQNHTQVVTVTKALQGWVASKVWVTHPWSSDWNYYCSNGPAKAGESTVFLVILDEYGSYSVTQTLPVSSDLAQDLMKDLAKTKDVDAGITEATAEDHALAIRDSIVELLKALMNKFAELKYWQNEAR